MSSWGRTGLNRSRLWRASALLASAAACFLLTGTALASTRGAVVDETFSCVVKLGGSAHYLDLQGNALSPRGLAAYALVYTASKAVDRKFVSQVYFDSASKGLRSDSSLCRRSSEKVALRRTGLSSGGTITVNFGGVLSERCTTTAHALVHVRLSLNAKGVPAKALLAIVSDDARRTPTAFVEWAPARVRYFVARNCVGRGSAAGP